MSDLLDPWEVVDLQRRPALEAELARELSPDHALSGMAARAIAKRIDRDDVLFEVPGIGYAVVRLTWSGPGESSPKWPSTTIFSSHEEWRAQGMMPDHEGYSSGG